MWKQQVNPTRVGVWKHQVTGAASRDADFFREAIIDADGSIAPTTGECKAGMGLSYDGRWGYHPLIVSLSNTGEPLYVVNRSGERPSHEGAAAYLDRAAALCREAGFRKITFRGDTDFSQTAHLDRWHGQGIRFIFGYDAVPSLKQRADELPESAWKPRLCGDLRGAEHRRGGDDECHDRGTPPSRRNVKDRIVRQKVLRTCGCWAKTWRVRHARACHRRTAWWWCAYISHERRAGAAVWTTGTSSHHQRSRARSGHCRNARPVRSEDRSAQAWSTRMHASGGSGEQLGLW